MARSLRTFTEAFPNSGAGAIIAVFGVEDDNTVIGEFASGARPGAGLIVGADVAVGLRSWNGQAGTPYIELRGGAANASQAFVHLSPPRALDDSNFSALWAGSIHELLDRTPALVAISGIGGLHRSGAGQGLVPLFTGVFGGASLPCDGTPIVVAGRCGPGGRSIWSGLAGGAIAQNGATAAPASGYNSAVAGLGVADAYSPVLRRDTLAVVVQGQVAAADIAAWGADPYGVMFVASGTKRWRCPAPTNMPPGTQATMSVYRRRLTDPAGALNAADVEMQGIAVSDGTYLRINHSAAVIGEQRFALVHPLTLAQGFNPGVSNIQSGLTVVTGVLE